MQHVSPPVDTESSGESGSVLKEHDYIGLAEVSSSIARPHADAGEDASPLHLNIEETDLRLGLGPAKKIEDVVGCEKTPPAFLPSRVNENSTKAMAGLDDHRPSQHHVWQSTQSLGQENPEEVQRILPAHSGTTRPSGTTSFYSAKNGTKRGYNTLTDAPKIGTAVDAKPLASTGGSVRGMNAENDVRNLPKPHQSAFLPSWATSKPPSSTPWHPGHEEPVSAYVSNKSSAMKPVVATYKQHSYCSDTADDAPPSKNQVVGWPPVGNYRKQQTLAKPAEMFVKVNMDGITVGRKVDLNLHSSYDRLFQALEDMFQPSIYDKQLRFRNGSDFVLTYEDRDGDWMLVGDVPWSLFVSTVRRLRIVRGSETTGLAPRGQVSVKCAV